MFLVAQFLWRTLRSLQSDEVSGYPPIADGQWAHLSDIMCQTIAHAYRNLDDALAPAIRLESAGSQAFQEYPGEIVGLCLHATCPDTIVAVRHNKPLEIARDPEGAVYLASARLAFPSPTNWHTRMCACASARINRNGTLQFTPFADKNLLPVATLPSPTAMEKQVIAMLINKGPCNIEQLLDSTLKLWPADALNQKETLVFEALAALLAEGRIAIENRPVPGMFNKGQAPQSWVRWLN